MGSAGTDASGAYKLTSISECKDSSGALVDTSPPCIWGDSEDNGVRCMELQFTGTVAGAADRGGWANRVIVSGEVANREQEWVAGEKICYYSVFIRPCQQTSSGYMNMMVWQPTGAAKPSMFYQDRSASGWANVTADFT